jgi:hypothetical protein
MWNRLTTLPWPCRCALKGGAFLMVLAAVLFPHPLHLVRHVRNLADTEALIQPDLPFIAQINTEIDATLPADFTRTQELKAVERYVYRAIPYAFDWEIWSNVDYWPSAAEVWEKRREDCDGRAILSASILRARGYKDARVEGNINHVWVVAGGKELMGPEKDKNFRREGGRIIVTPPKAETLLRGMAQVRHFPAWRLGVLVLATVILALHPSRNRRSWAWSAGTGLAGLAMLYAWAAASQEGETAGIMLASSVALFLTSLGLALLLPRWLAGRTPVVDALPTRVVPQA